VHAEEEDQSEYQDRHRGCLMRLRADCALAR